MSDDQAREYVETLNEEINDGTDNPSVAVTGDPAFSRIYESLTDDATISRGSETHWEGWYEILFYREEKRFATVNFVVQSMKIIHRRGEHTYTIKLDRLDGFNLTVELPTHEEVPDDEYRTGFREMFSEIGLPPEVIDDLTFEYTPTVW